MAVNGSTSSHSFMEFPLAMKRQGAFPLDENSVFYSMSEAQTYATSNPTAYVGQVISVVADGVSTIYQIKNTAGELEPLGTGDLEGDVASVINAKTASTENINEMIGEVYGAENEAEG